VHLCFQLFDKLKKRCVTLCSASGEPRLGPTMEAPGPKRKTDWGVAWSCHSVETATSAGGISSAS
jgi:hypothetical protein